MTHLSARWRVVRGQDGEEKKHTDDAHKRERANAQRVAVIGKPYCANQEQRRTHYSNKDKFIRVVCVMQPTAEVRWSLIT
uniref:Transposase n=1 Tax=Ascaris lumbricoides TaxID=6252 RepID=A0A0M3HQP8_ASCLU